LEHQKVASLLVVEALEAVIEWHAEGLVPLGPELTGDPVRSRMRPLRAANAFEHEAQAASSSHRIGGFCSRPMAATIRFPASA
jgi:hypothetical protein